MWKFEYQNDLWSTSDVDITIHVIAYNRLPQLLSLVWAFSSQKEKNFKVFITHDGENINIRNQIIGLGNLIGYPLSFKESESHNGIWGYALRQQCLMECNTLFWMSTNDDSWYSPTFTKELQQIMHTNPDLILVDMVHSHLNPGGRPQTDYQAFTTQASLCNCDIGSFIVRTQLAQKMGGFPIYHHDADGFFINKFVSTYPCATITKINKILYVHN